MRNDSEFLRRIARRLVALADIAELASLRSRPILWLVFWLLRPAEAVARDFAHEIADRLGVPANLPVERAVSAAEEIGADAMLRLAVNLRLLAAVLSYFAELAVAGDEPACRGNLGQLLSTLVARTAFAAPSDVRCGFAYADTS